MKFETIVDALTAEQYESLKTAVELGKWPDNQILAGEQRELSLRILIAYDLKHKAEQDRIGYVPVAKPTDCEHDHDHDQKPAANVIAKG